MIYYEYSILKVKYKYIWFNDIYHIYEHV